MTKVPARKERVNVKVINWVQVRGCSSEQFSVSIHKRYVVCTSKDLLTDTVILNIQNIPFEETSNEYNTFQYLLWKALLYVLIRTIS